MATVFMSGFETGDFQEWNENLTVTVPGSVEPRTGSYCLSRVSTAQAYVGRTGFNASTLYVRFYFFPPTNTYPSTSNIEICNLLNSSNTVILKVVCSGWVGNIAKVCLYDNTTPIGDYTAVNQNTWNLIELKFVAGSGTGICEMKVNGAVAGTASNRTFTTNVDKLRLGPITTDAALPTFKWDDVLVSNSAYPGPGGCVARQVKAGSPTYNAFTKSNGSTIDTVWANTPVSATTYAASPGTASTEAQTGLIASFSPTIAATDTINACSLVCIAKRSSGSSRTHALRRRVASADTDTVVTLTTSDALYRDGYWTATLTNLNSMEAGAVKSGGTTGQQITVEDLWVMVDYTYVPQALTGTFVMWHQEGL